jgi:hypothetical protein
MSRNDQKAEFDGDAWQRLQQQQERLFADFQAGRLTEAEFQRRTAALNDERLRSLE